MALPVLSVHPRLCFPRRKLGRVKELRRFDYLALLTTPSLSVQLEPGRKFTCECLITPTLELNVRQRFNVLLLPSLSLSLSNLLQGQVKWAVLHYYNSGYNQLC